MLLASRTVSWNPVSFAQVAADAMSKGDQTLSRTATDRSLHSAADYAPGENTTWADMFPMCGTFCSWFLLAADTWLGHIGLQETTAYRGGTGQ